MSNETKQDVFLQLAKENRDLRMYDPESIEPKELIEQDYQDWIREYAAALPDDLPVIPLTVGEYIKNLWKYHRDLVDVFGMVRDLGITRTEPNGVLIWVAHNTDTFASAWVLGVWRVEETGEIVKLEAEK